MAKTIKTYIVLRNDTTANWELHSDQVLRKGEAGVEFLTDGTTKIKIGDGVTPWAELGYSSGDAKLENGALLETITQESIEQWNSAQPNTIEQIFVNGSEVSIIDKQVQLTIPTKASDIGAASSDHDHDGVYLKSDEPIPESLLPAYAENVIEVFKMAGEVVPIEDKVVEIPVASDVNYGVVKSSSGMNQVSVSSDGTMRVESISMSSLVVPDGEEIIMDGGNAG